MASDVDTSLDNWSTTANSNSPTGTTAISTNLDDNLREIQAKVRTLRSSGTIASAATTDLSTVEDNYISVTGTTTISALGTLTAGMSKVLIFSDALTLTHNGTSLILPGAANITTAAGDIAVMLSLGSGNWRCVGYMDASSAPYNAASVDINGGTIDGTVIGGTTPAAGTFTTFTSTGIDDNATTETFQLGNAQADWGQSGNTFTHLRNVTDSWMAFSGSTAVNTGANVLCYGDAHSTSPNVLRLRQGSTDAIRIDTNIEISKNLELDGADIFQALATDAFIVSGGTTNILGGAILLYGQNHDSQAGDVALRSSNNEFFRWDESAGTLTLSTGIGSKTTAITIESTQVVSLKDDTALVWGTGTSRPAIIGDTVADTLDFYTSGSSALTLDSSQNATFASNILFSGANWQLKSSTSDAADTSSGALGGGGGIGTSRGGYVQCFGNENATAAGDVRIYGGAVAGGGDIDIQAGSVAGQITLATGGNTALTIDSSQNWVHGANNIWTDSTNSYLLLSGGNALSTGGELMLFGSTHSTSPNAIKLRNAGATALEIDASGNVGIGVTPEAWQTGRAAIQLGPTASLHCSGTTSTASTVLGNNYYRSATGATYQVTNHSAIYYQLNGEHVWETAPSGTAGTSITFSEAMKIDNAGNVGIGDTSPDTQLHVTASTTNTSAGLFQVSATATGTTGGSGIVLRNTDTSSSSVHGIAFNVVTSTAQEKHAAGIYCVKEAAWTNNDLPTYDAGLAFFTRANGGNQAEAMRIDSSGHAIIPAGVTLGTAAGTYNAANTLDDYEEGTYTATLTPETSGTITLQSTQDLLSYVKVGCLVTVSGQLKVNSVSSPVGGNVRVSLPFAVADLTEFAERSGFAQSFYDTSPGAITLAAVCIGGASYFNVYVDAATLSSTSTFYIGMTYRTT
jgi:hypothetical protein